MANEKNINSRIQHKHDTEANWNKATNFIPKQGELIVYDIDENYDYQRIKIGDGVTNVNELPFWDKGIEDKLIENAPNLEADRGEPGYIANRPGYRIINKDVNTTIEVVEAGNYCLLDFSTVNEDFVNNYLTYEELIRDYSRTYDFYYSFDLVEAETGLLLASILTRVGDKIKLLDDINCYINVQMSDTIFYIVHNRDLLSEELKEKIPYNGIWFISNLAISPFGGQIRNFWFREYIYKKFDPNLIPNNVMFKRDMGEYVTQEEMDVAIAALVNSAPETLDTLGELATAFEENADMVATLDAAVTNKAEKAELESAQDLIEVNAKNIGSMQTVLNKYSTETWTFTLDNGSTVTKKMVILS